ncbi:preprotein translocase subunit SecG [Rhizobium sp. BK313]|jgi:preprotein translocase subunit SecG|uniref:preprotein translocase subunit SecG n=1 Tax=Rhizobium sp. BK313 TaxID=2587081 RepID=UPI00105EA675|nr:preprotein translocase subunit SecG [Rhizobium sp. BK313]MBB3453167.1 preprotein translocase subunit SecG [Rhizobium sp. BK313]
MQTVLLVIYLMVVIALIGVVLIQRSEGGGLGIGGGSGFMSARGTANALTRTTAILAALFFVLALGMNVYSRFEGRPTDILNRIPSTAGQGNGILDSLGGQKGAAPAGGQSQPANNSGVPNSGAVAPQSQTTTQQAPAATTTQQPAATTTTQPAPAAAGQQTPPATTTTTPTQSGNGVPTGQ